MTMHLVHPGLSTNNIKTKKKLSAKQLKAKADHEVWLRKNNIHPDQLSLRTSKKPNKLVLDLVKDKNTAECTNGFAQGGFKKSIFDTKWQKPYEEDPLMAEREAIALSKAEEIKGRLMPLYNKGPVQLMTAKTSLKDGNGRGKN